MSLPKGRRTTSGARSLLVRSIPALALLGVATGCGGGGGGSGAGTTSSSFFVTDVKYGRLIDEGNGPRLVSPLTTVDVDAITGKVIPGSLQPMANGVDVNALQTFGIGINYLPCVIPRNGVLQVEFSAPVNAATIFADIIDTDGSILNDGSVQVRTEAGKGVAVALSQPSPNVIWINPVTSLTVGFPPSPVDFGPDGEARADATGFLRLILPKTGGSVIQSTHGAMLGSRVDKLGDVVNPIGFNPGNRVLDFISQNQLIPTDDSFNGFLPDISPPRIIRTYAYSKTLAFGSGDSSTSSSLTDAAASFSTDARSGLGEWASGQMVLRPGLATEERHVVLSNTATTVTIVDVFTADPQDGDVYRLERAEFFEPDPANPIDPDHFDPNDPENSNNSVFSNFVAAYEIDASGNVLNGPLPLGTPIPPFSELRVQFNEPISTDSVSPYEDFQVRFDPDQGPGSEILSQTLLDATQRTVILRPSREDQSNSTSTVVGWGKNVKVLRFNLSLIPKSGYLQTHMDADLVTAFLEKGYRGVTDLGGQPIAFPDSVFDPSDPVITFTTPFTSDESQSTQNPAPLVESWGVIVHRMQGRPHTGIDPDTGNPGVKYLDQINYYSPIADINLLANGFLAGSPVVYITKIHDDYFPPPHGQYSAFPLGAGFPLQSLTTAAGPQPHDGARFQTVYRDIDCSPNRDALAGTLLDLYRLSWAPIGGNVTTDTYNDISVHCAHSSYRPQTPNNTASAQFQLSGLGPPFDFKSWESLVDPNTTDVCPGGCENNQGPNYYDTLVTVVPPGTTYKVTQASLFTPPFDAHPYCPWPVFTTRFQYNNGDIPKAEKAQRDAENAAFNCPAGSGDKVWLETRTYSSDEDLNNLGGDSLLVEYRIRPQLTNISRANGFTMAIGCLLDWKPHFRTYTVGTPGAVINPDGSKKGELCARHDTATPVDVDDFSGIVNGKNNGDNDRYFAAFDYVKSTSIITSPYVRVYPTLTASPDYFPPVIEPNPADQPAGTTVKLEFQGANNVKGAGPTGFSTDVNIADTRPNLGFRATFVGNLTTLLLPNFDLIAIPYKRPLGD
ncbi:MAG TPA: hypothetical protein VFG37_06605 [Planctomycetota bacterium]|nr:hypothetical protein [Planctomycetota bacterium]